MNMSMTNWILKPAWMIRIALAACLGLSASARAANWYVATNGSGAAGMAWDTAFTNVQDALNVAASNDTIHLAGHTFGITNPINWTRSYVSIRGGYAATNAADKPGPRDSTLWPTVIRRVSGWSRIMSVSGVTNGVLEQVTLADGYSATGDHGGGLYIYASVGFVLTNCAVLNNRSAGTGNQGNGYGGGLYAEASSGTIAACEIAGNGIYATSWDQKLHGGGVCLKAGEWTIRDSVLAGNNTHRHDVDILKRRITLRDRLYGGGLYVDGGTHTVVNCAIYGNNGCTDIRQGGGLYVNNGTVSVRHSSIVGNGLEGVRRVNGTVSLTDCILWHNGSDVLGTVAVNFCNVETGGYAGSYDNISDDPQFARGLYLAPGSTSRNVGSDDASVFGLEAYTTQTNGTPDTGRVDLGYHYPHGLLPEYADLHVAANGDDANSGTTPSQALRTVTRALKIARDGTHVSVGTGIYSVATGETLPLVMRRPGLHLAGAGVGETIFDGGDARQVFNIRAIPAGGRLAHVTVARGYIERGYGAGIGVWQSRLIFDAIRVERSRNHSAEGSARPNIDMNYGGGIGAVMSAVTLQDSVVVSNRADCVSFDNTTYGGGIGIQGGDWSIDRAIVSGNTAAGSGRSNDRGGGIYINGGIQDFRSLVVRDNRASGITTSPRAYGAGIFVRGGAQRFKNLLIHGNRTEKRHTFQGDGVYITSDSNAVTFENCTVVDNDGEGIRQDGARTNTVVNSILWGNGVDATGTMAIAWSDIGVVDPAITANNCFSVDPLFADTTYYHIQSRGGNYAGGYFTDGTWVTSASNSPCIDAGDPASEYAAEPAPNGRRVNMGAYGNTAVASKTVIRGSLITIR